MNIQSCLKEYKELINKADAFYEIQIGCTIDQGESNPVIIETIIYNGYSSPKKFKAKLYSLTSILREEIESYYELKDAGFTLYGDTLFEDIDALKLNFKVSDKKIRHLKYHLQTATGTESRPNIAALFSEFINISYYSLEELLNDNQAKLLESIFSRREKRQQDLIFVNNVFKERNIVNDEGKSVLRARKKFLLWTVIDVLREQHIINKNLPEALYMSFFWKYTRGEGKPPEKKHIEAKSYIKEKEITNIIVKKLLASQE